MEVGTAAERYAEALKVLIEDKSIDATLVMHAPSALASSDGAAKAVIDTSRRHGGSVLTSWIGGETVASARQMFADAGLPTYDTPRQAVRAFLHMVHYKRNQEMLMQTPPSAPAEFVPRTDAARAVVARALTETGGVLSGPAAKEVLAAYGVPVAESRFARTPEEAGTVAGELGYPGALSIISPDVPRKWEVGGVALHLSSREAVNRGGAADGRAGASGHCWSAHLRLLDATHDLPSACTPTDDRRGHGSSLRASDHLR
jgi:acetyltransferase